MSWKPCPEQAVIADGAVTLTCDNPYGLGHEGAHHDHKHGIRWKVDACNIPEAPSEPVPAMLTVGGRRFACECCGANVFTRSGDVFAGNGCGTLYSSSGRKADGA